MDEWNGMLQHLAAPPFFNIESSVNVNIAVRAHHHHVEDQRAYSELEPEYGAELGYGGSLYVLIQPVQDPGDG